MGLLDGTTQNAYYEQGEKGSYQFTSLEDIVNYFMVVYVGEGKTISKVSKTDVAFHAQRAMQELSFDTFKSVKSQEIVLPPSNTMMLPHDYVNYTKISWSDAAGIKHPLYPTSNTSNPFKILQEDDGAYDFTLAASGVDFENGDFSTSIANSRWFQSPQHGQGQGALQHISGDQYEWKHIARSLGDGISSGTGTPTTRHYALWQSINVTEVDLITVSAKGLSSAAKTGKTAGVVRVGISSIVDTTFGNTGYNPKNTNPNSGVPSKISRNMDPTIFDVPNLSGANNYIQFDAGDDTLSAATELVDVDVSGLTTVYLLAVSSGGTIDSTATLSNSAGTNSPTFGINAIDDIVLTFEASTANLQSGGESTTWSSYKSNSSNDNSNPEIHSYDTDIYDFNIGERYGLSPEHAQVNGSYYVDNLRGLINFSSNVSGKTVILDYISDSLGTDGEMQVHKFAEEAMYKWIMYAVLSTRANTPEYIVRRYQKEKFAATRTAKLRLSNIKLEELTQILRGKSKWIKH